MQSNNEKAQANSCCIYLSTTKSLKATNFFSEQFNSLQTTTWQNVDDEAFQLANYYKDQN